MSGSTHGLFEFVCSQCNTTVYATGPPVSSGDRSIIVRGWHVKQTTIESDCNDQMASDIIEEGWHIL